MVDKEFDNLDLRFCGMLRSVDWWLFTDVSWHRSHQSTLLNVLEERRSHLNRHGILKLRYFPVLLRYSRGKYVS